MNLRLKEMSIDSYKSIIEYNPDAIFILSLDGTIVEINQVTIKMLGYRKEEIQGKNYRELLIPECIDFTNQQFEQVLCGHSPEYETQLLHGNGEMVYLQVKNFPLWENGVVVGVFGVAKDITELHHAKATLNQMEGWMNALFYSTGDAIEILDLDGNVVNVNPAFEGLYGWKQNELMGKPLPIIPEFRYNHQKDMLIQAMNEKQIETIDTIRIRKDGTPIDVGLTFSPILDKKGNVLGTAGITRDITERKQLEKSLKESEERNRKVVEFSPKGIVIHQNGKILYANPSALKIANEENLIGKSIFSYLHPDFFEAIKERIAQSQIGKEMPTIEEKIIRKNGEIIDAEIGGVGIQYDGQPATLVMFDEITERKKAERELRESEKRYKRLVEFSPEPIIVHHNGRIQYANPSFIKLLGASSLIELEGKNIIDFSPPEYKELVNQRIQELNRTGIFVAPMEEKVIRLDGTLIDVEVTGISLNYNDKPSYLMMIHDLTERKMYEEKLTYFAFHDTLTKLPNRRLFKDQFEQAIKEAVRCKRKMAVMYMDLDKFKTINDTLGHDVGDDLLKQYAKRVKGCLREGDTLSRQGGDEFTILLPEIQEEQDALHIAQRIIDSLQHPWEIGENVFHTTSSIGIAFYPMNGTTRSELMTTADKALYEAKEDGGNHYKIYQV